GIAALDGAGVAALTVATLGPGTHAITAAYGGDATYAASTSPAVSQAVTLPGTATALASSANPSAPRPAVPLTANRSPPPGSGTPTGTVQFRIDGVDFGAPVALVDGVALSASFNASAAGTYTVTAAYSGDAGFPASSATLTQTVNPDKTTTTVTTSPGFAF